MVTMQRVTTISMRVKPLRPKAPTFEYCNMLADLNIRIGPDARLEANVRIGTNVRLCKAAKENPLKAP
jgi:hypothetical protein